MRKIERPVCPNPEGLKTNYKHPDIKRALLDAFFGKCMYCESKITQVYFGDVEHIKPKSKYPMLEVEWSNLGFVCARCNNAKSDKYEDETPYINPYDEDPEDKLIAFGSQLRQKNGSERGELTIKDINLNRLELIEKRQVIIDNLSLAIDACMRTKNESLKHAAFDALKEEAELNKEYSLFAKTLLHLHGIM